MAIMYLLPSDQGIWAQWVGSAITVLVVCLSIRYVGVWAVEVRTKHSRSKDCLATEIQINVWVNKDGRRRRRIFSQPSGPVSSHKESQYRVPSGKFPMEQSSTSSLTDVLALKNGGNTGLCIGFGLDLILKWTSSFYA
jgi:hypothetical protein